MALGADGRLVVRLLVAEGFNSVVIGGALGLALAIATARLLAGLLFKFKVDVLDPGSLLGVPSCSVLLGCSPPNVLARRASRVDPVTALRTD